jgi:hypothetical protein
VIAIRPRADQVASPGERIVIDRPEPDDPITIAQERTLPERVALLGARRVTREQLITLTSLDVVWVHAVLGEIICAAQPDPGLAEIPPDHLRAMYRDLTILIEQEPNVVVHGALVIRRAEVERAIAVSNVRATRDGDL